MNTKRKRVWMSWAMALMILFSAVSPMNVVLADEDMTMEGALVEPEGKPDESAPGETPGEGAGPKEGAGEDGPEKGEAEPAGQTPAGVGKAGLGAPMGDLPVGPASHDGPSVEVDPNILEAAVVVKINGEEVEEDEEDDTILSTDVITIELSMKVPVAADFVELPEVGQYVRHGDTAVVRLGKGFTVSSATSINLIGPEDKVIGHVTLTTDIDGVVWANILFDWNEEEVTPDDMNIEAGFNATLAYNEDAAEEDGEGNKFITILEKPFIITEPVIPIDYAVAKSGTILWDEQAVEWEVTISATQEGAEVNADLESFVFRDNLNGVGDYVPYSLTVGGDLATPVDTTPALTYEFGEEDQTPQIIKFKTDIDDTIYFANTNGRTINNKAELIHPEDPTPIEGSASVTLNKWITKSVPAGGIDEREENGNYKPTGRTVTWEIIANESEAELDDVVITDVAKNGLEIQSATWYKWNGTAWVDETVLSAPESGSYNLGNIDTKIKLVVVTTVPDVPTGGVVTETTYNNAATITWDGVPPAIGSVDTDDVGVGVGYNPISKEGELVTTADADRRINWTVTVDPAGQDLAPSGETIRVYDLLVYGGSAVTNPDAASLPVGITWAQLVPTQQRLHQRYYPASFAATEGDPAPTLTNVYTITKDGVAVADLLEITVSPTARNQFKFQSQVVDRAVFAKNASTTIWNTAMLFRDTNRLNFANESEAYLSRLLRKQLLKRTSAGDTAASANGSNIGGVSEGFDHLTRTAIFRLSVNAGSLNLTGADLDSGAVTVTDILPKGWVFDRSYYKIFEGTFHASNTSVAAGADVTATLGITPSFEAAAGADGEKVSFTFNTLAQPYVILVKAQLTEAAYEEYLKTNGGANGYVTLTNRSTLTTVNWGPTATSNHDIRVQSRVLDKTHELDSVGASVTWTVDYNPFELHLQGAVIKDTLSEGLELPITADGTPKWEHITVTKMVMNAAGGLDPAPLPNTVDPASCITYDNATRTLSFTAPDARQAYRLTYKTDITITSGSATLGNSVRLEGETEADGASTNQSFGVSYQSGWATLQRGGNLTITKRDGITNQLLPGAEFTLFASDGTTVIRRGVSDANGVITMRGIPADGIYILRETGTPANYEAPEGGHIVEVATVGGDVVTTINGGSNQLTAKNYRTDAPVGSLRIRKTVAGDNAETDKPFTFTVTLLDASNNPLTGTYTYTGVGVPGGDISSGGTISLAHGQSVTITGLPEHTKYTVVEGDYSSDGYNTVSVGETGTVESQQTHLAYFTNTRNQPGELTISKTVEGVVNEPGRLFEFTVTINTPVTPPVGGYTYKGHGGASDGTIVSGGKIYLADGESITIEGLPEDATYQVVETNYSDEGYAVIVVGATGTVDTLGGHSAAFTNRTPGSLTITKTVAGNVGDRTKKFDFTVTLLDASGNPLTGTYTYTGVGVPGGTIQSGDTIALADGESITIAGLPADTDYRVVEASYAREGYVTTSTGATGTIPAGDERIASFTNTNNYYPSDDPTGSLTIRKTVGGTLGDREKKFAFVVTFNAGGLYSYSGSRSGMLSSGQRILLGHDEYIEIVGLPVGTTYEVVEEEANRDGYRTTSTGAVGTISRSGKTAEFTNTRGGTNPNTGDDASTGSAAFGVIAFSLLLTGLFVLERRLNRSNKTREQN